MRRCFLRSAFLILLAAALTVSAFAIPSDPLSGGSAIVGDEYIPDFDSSIDNPYFTGTLRISPSCVEMLKKMEGYLQKPKGDYQQYSIGYGCNTKYLRKYYDKLDISETDMEMVLSSSYPNYILKEEKAEALMLYVLDEVEDTLDKFLNKYSISVNQYQYDALMSFTYNLGNTWMKEDTRLASLLISGEYTVNEFASAMGVYCHAGTEILDILVSRRIQEIKLFLFGAYQLDAVEEKFCTVVFEADNGEVETDIGYYEEGKPYQILFGAESEDPMMPYFVGWYTADGQKITASSIVGQEDRLTVYARFSDVQEDPELFVAADFYKPADNPSVGQTDYVGGATELIDVTTVFSDMNVDDWHYPYVCQLYTLGNIDGFPDKTFRPNDTVTTGQALKMILLASGYEQPPKVASHWARNFMNLALDEGIIVRGEITDLDVPISRGLMAKIVAKSMKLSRLYDHTVFTDTTDEYVATLYDFGISDGYPDGTFRPTKNLTRAELSAIVSRMYHIRDLYDIQ